MNYFKKTKLKNKFNKNHNKYGEKLIGDLMIKI